MTQIKHDQSSPNLIDHSQSSSSNLFMKDLNTIKIKKIGKSFNIIDSPQIVFDLCDKAFIKSRQLDHSTLLNKNKIDITKNLLQEKRKLLQRRAFFANRNQSIPQDNFNYQDKKLITNQFNNSSLADKLSYLDDRKFYTTIKDKLKQFVYKIQSEKQIMISQVLMLKQDILSSFFAEIIQKIKRQCKQKGLLIHYIWNSMFNILQIVIKQLTKQKNLTQKQYLNQNIQNHKKYQDMLQYDKQKIIIMKQKLQKAQVFNNTLVFNLRCKKRQIRKACIKLKVCTNKLNQYKQNFLDLQRDHIDLLMETRDISKQMAQYLFKRRQQILQDKKKTYKLKFSKKSNFATTKKQIESEPPTQLQQVNQQLKTAFSKEYQKQIKKNSNNKLKKLTNFLFEEAMDQFAFYQNDNAIDEDIMASRMKTTFVDAETDMIGFQIDVQQKECQVDYIQKIVIGFVRNSADQTNAIEEKVKKIYVEEQAQADSIQINKMQYSINNKIYDMSFLFEKKNVNDIRKFNIQKDMSGKSIKKIVPGNRRNSINQKSNQGSQISINFTSKQKIQSKKRISRRISEISSLSKREIEDLNLDEQNEDQISKQNIQDQEDQNNDNSVAFNFQDLISKFALKKGLAKKKKTGLSVNVDRQNRNSDMENIQQASNSLSKGFIKTQKNSRFSRQNLTKRNSNSLNVNFSQPKKKRSFINEAQQQWDGQKKKNLRRQAITKNKKQTSPDRNLSRFNQMKFSNSPQKSRVVKLLSKSVRDSSSLDLNETIQNLKMQNPNIQINKEMQEFIKNRRCQQKEKFFKNFSQSMAPLISDLFKNIQATRKYHKTLLPARHKNLCKIISSVYLQAYQLLDKKQSLYSLINPLFKYFQIGYGMLNKYDLYSRMISFLSHVCIHKEESYILYTFFFFTGIDKENPLSKRITAQDFQLYLKLLKSLSFNFSLTSGIMGLNVQNMFTSNLVLEKNTKQLLIQQKLSQVIIQKVIQKVQQRLQKLTGVDMRSTHLQSQFTSKFNGSSTNLSRNSPFSRSQSTWNTARLPKGNQQQEEIKLDVFKCCQLIMEEIISMRKCIEQSYLPLINHVYEEEQQIEDYRVDQLLIQFIIRCQFRQHVNEIKSYQLLNNIFKINTLYNQYKAKIVSKKSPQKSNKQLKTIRTLKTIKFIVPQNQNYEEQKQKQTLSLNQMCSFFLKANISDFNKTYYNALNIFKLRQQAAFSMCIKRLPQIRIFFEKQDLKIELILLQQITQDGKLDNLMSQTGQGFQQTFSQSFYRSFNGRLSPNTQRESTNGMTLKQIHNKKLLILCFLRFLQSKTNQSVSSVLGDQLQFLHNYMGISKMKV